jgi:transposase InsO family protein
LFETNQTNRLLQEPERVTKMTLQQKIIRNKLGLLNLAEELGNVSRACKVMGFSRDTFYRYKELVEEGGVDNLIEKTRRKPNLKNRIDQAVETAILKLAVDYPAYGQDRVCNELRKLGFFISPCGVRGVWLRHGLEVFKKRLSLLEKKIAEEGIILTDSQIRALERKKQDDEACGEIETEHPGYLGSQDTFYIGMMKGVGRIYQQTFVDTYSKIAICKLYTTRRPINAADVLNDRVLPFFEAYGVQLQRILTDRGSEYCGRQEQHDYQLFLAVNEIEHTKTKAYSPQTNGICERFHKTILQEFYQVTFRKKLYQNVEELQTDLDVWLKEFNEQRTHQGKMCCGRTPIDTFIDGLKIWREKQISKTSI